MYKLICEEMNLFKRMQRYNIFTYLPNVCDKLHRYLSKLKKVLKQIKH